VGLIDDGVVYKSSVRSNIKGGKSFCRRDKDQNLNEPHYVSSGGHGTAMAELICRVCPNVKLYIVKLDERLGRESGKREITAISAAKVC
jgi:hypothetical protein